MCFQSVDDYDWIASVYEVSDEVATERLRCCECGGRINVGEKCRSVYMQRYEECRLCCGDIREQWDHDYEGQKLPPCDNDQHDYGETVQDYVCERCCKMIETIEEVENAEGCTAPHNRPLHGELREAFWESDHAVEYIDRARDKFPELAACGYLDKVYKLTREYDDEIGDRWECRDIRKHDEIFDMIGGEG